MTYQIICANYVFIPVDNIKIWEVISLGKVHTGVKFLPDSNDSAIAPK